MTKRKSRTCCLDQILPRKGRAKRANLTSVCIVVASVGLFPSFARASQTYVHYDKLVEEYEEDWNDKRGKAVEFDSQRSKYRLYMPDRSERNGIVTISFKLDHIRGTFPDDHAVVTSEKHNVTAKVIDFRVKVDWWMGEDFDSDLLELPDGAEATQEGAIAKVVLEAITKVLQASRSGGESDFPNVITHAINRVVKNSH